jgi:hypothetical protein
MSRRDRSVVGLVPAVAVALLLGGCGGGSTTTTTTTTTTTSRQGRETSGFARLPTHRCSTKTGVEQGAQPLGAFTTVPMAPVSGIKLTAYRDIQGTTVVAPSGWHCSALVGVDGNETVEVYSGEAPNDPSGVLPRNIHGGPGVTLINQPSCQGCIASTICALLPDEKIVQTYRSQGGFDCRPKPLREKVSEFGSGKVLFTDPPGVAGQGQPSGGPFTSYGALSYSSFAGARQATCALPESLAPACPGIVAAAMAGTGL